MPKTLALALALLIAPSPALAADGAQSQQRHALVQDALKEINTIQHGLVAEAARADRKRRTRPLVPCLDRQVGLAETLVSVGQKARGEMFEALAAGDTTAASLAERKIAVALSKARNLRNAKATCAAEVKAQATAAGQVADRG